VLDALPTLPAALHRGEADLPFVDLGDGSTLQLLQVDLDQGLWVLRTRFQPGYRVQTHRHTGTVLAFTTSGRWHYLEYPEVNTAGSYLFEPAGSTHTLVVPEDNDEVTEVCFAISGANLNLDADGRVESVLDAALILKIYLVLCAAQGFDHPAVIGAPTIE